MTNDKESGRKIIPIREGIFMMRSESEGGPYLIGSRCKSCNQISFPTRAVCSQCFSQEMEKIPLSTKGKLYTYTIIGYPPPGVTSPYAIGYIDIPEGVRVFSILTDWDNENLKIGLDMELVLEKFREDKEGNEILTYKFRPVQGQRRS